MMPVIPSVKRLSGFSIDSLMGKERRESSPSPASTALPAGRKDEDDARRSSSPPAPPRREGLSLGGVGSSFHPVHPGSSSLKYDHSPYPDGFPAGLPHPAALHGLPAGLGGALHGGLHPHHPVLPPHHLLLGAQRELFPLHPWLLGRHGGFLNPRLAGPEGLLLQPFRKPKRIRTAFSPSQLLRLEHAFEKNHYVVGQERKELAQNLSLTETQVKVWFQNRRTKYKRMKAEEAEGQGGRPPSSPHSPVSPGAGDDDDDDLELDVVQGMSEDEEEEEEERRRLAARMGLHAATMTSQNRSPSPSSPTPPREPHPHQLPPSPHLPSSPSPPHPSSPSPAHLSDRAPLHLNRWRAETNQVGSG